MRCGAVELYIRKYIGLNGLETQSEYLDEINLVHNTFRLQVKIAAKKLVQ